MPTLSPFERLAQVLCDNGYSLVLFRADESGAVAVFQDEITSGWTFSLVVPLGVLPEGIKRKVLQGISDEPADTSFGV